LELRWRERRKQTQRLQAVPTLSLSLLPELVREGATPYPATAPALDHIHRFGASREASRRKHKARSNVQNHGVSFEEASSVFLDPYYLAIDDPTATDRFIALGF
jgi:hypothetical protein